MRIRYSFQGRETVFDQDVTQAVIGRPLGEGMPDLNLAPDMRVSRRHARIWVEQGLCWIEDLNSAGGTLVNGEEIKGQGRRQLREGDAIRCGETDLSVESLPKPRDSYVTVIASLDELEGRDPYATIIAPLDEAEEVVDANAPVFTSGNLHLTANEQRLALFYELALQFGHETQLEALLQLIVERLVAVIPGAARAAALVKEPGTERLLLLASLPAGGACVSLTLAREAMEQRKAFIWPSAAGGLKGQEPSVRSPSMVERRIESAMYAPLLWKHDVLGVVCVDSCNATVVFTSDDLLLLRAVAHHAAIAVANLRLQEELQREAKRLGNLLKLVSPQIAERLMQHRGPLRLGGEFCQATILFSDIRGFTNLSATMSPGDVTEMLEDYFGRLAPIVFKHGGTIDKFVGDAILAVFGSPKPDDEQQAHAILAAREMQRAMQEVNAQRAARGQRTGELGIGIHCGEVVHGLIGTAERMEFTVIGDAVNRASRYCDGALAGEVLLSPAVHQRVWNLVEVEQTAITTKHEGALTAYRLKRIR